MQITRRSFQEPLILGEWIKIHEASLHRFNSDYVLKSLGNYLRSIKSIELPEFVNSF